MVVNTGFKTKIFNSSFSYFVFFCFLGLVFHNQIFFGYYYDPTSFLSIWHPWASEISERHMINFVLSDQVDAIIPTYLTFVEKLSFWNPNLAFGTQEIILSSAVFSPFNLLLFIFPGQTGLTIISLLQISCSGFFMFLLLRKLNIDSFFAVLGGVLYMFSSKLIVNTGISVGYVIAFLPLYFYAIRSLFSGSTKRASVLLVISTCSIILSGFVHLIAFAFIFGGMYFIVLFLKSKQTSSIYQFTLSSLIGILLTSFILFPTFYYFLEIDTSYRQNYWNWELPLRNFLHFINPSFFGNPVFNTWWSTSNMNEHSIYFGILPAAFIIPSIFVNLKKRNYELLFYFVVFVIITFLCFNILSVKHLYKYIPFINQHPPTRLSNFMPFFGIVVSVYGMNRIYKDYFKNRFLLILLSVITICFVIVSMVAFSSIDNPVLNNRFFVMNHHLSIALISTTLILGILTIFRRNILKDYILGSKFSFRFIFLVLSGFILGTLIYLYMHYSNGVSTEFREHYLVILIIIVILGVTINIINWFCKHERKTLLILGIIASLDIFLYTYSYRPSTSEETFYPQTEEIDFLKNNLEFNQRIMTIGRNFLPNTNSAYNIPSIQAHFWTDDVYKRYMQLIDSSYLAGHGTMAFFDKNSKINSNLTDLFNVKYIVSNLDYSPNEAYIAQQKEYNSFIDMHYNQDIIQTFQSFNDEYLNIATIKSAAYVINKPLRIKASIFHELNELGSSTIEIYQACLSTKTLTFRFDEPIELDKGCIYQLKISLLRKLNDGEYFKINSVRDVDIYKSGELLNNENSDITFSIIRSEPLIDKYILRLQKSVKIFENKACSGSGLYQIKELFSYRDENLVYDSILKLDPHQFAFVEEADFVNMNTRSFKIGKNDTMFFDEYDYDYMRINLSFEHNGFILIPDTYFNGWKAYIDGEEVKIYKTDLIFRGISVPKGIHTIELRYNPPLFRLGLIISVITLLVFLVLIIISNHNQLLKREYPLML